MCWIGYLWKLLIRTLEANKRLKKPTRRAVALGRSRELNCASCRKGSLEKERDEEERKKSRKHKTHVVGAC